MKWTLPISGALAGLANGLFGGGGGMVLVPLLSRFGKLPDRTLYPTCVAIIFPICAASAAVCLWQDPSVFSQALPYLLGGAVGGLIGGALYQKVPVQWLRWLFAGFLIYGAVRYLL